MFVGMVMRYLYRVDENNSSASIIPLTAMTGSGTNRALSMRKMITRKSESDDDIWESSNNGSDCLRSEKYSKNKICGGPQDAVEMNNCELLMQRGPDSRARIGAWSIGTGRKEEVNKSRTLGALTLNQTMANGCVTEMNHCCNEEVMDDDMLLYRSCIFNPSLMVMLPAVRSMSGFFLILIFRIVPYLPAWIVFDNGFNALGRSEAVVLLAIIKKRDGPLSGFVSILITPQCFAQWDAIADQAERPSCTAFYR